MRSILASLALAAVGVAAVPAHAQDTGMPAAVRPVPSSLGIGIGYQIGAGTDITEPNRASIRVVMNEKFMLEPYVDLSYRKQTVDPPGALPSTKSSTTTLAVGATGRFLLASRGKVDLVGLGDLRFSHVGNDDTQDDNQQTLSVRWGLGLMWFFSSQWSLSFDALNPLVGLTRTEVDGGATNTTWDAGLRFRQLPDLFATVHLYF